MSLVPIIESSLIVKNTGQKQIDILGAMRLKPGFSVDVMKIIPNLTEFEAFRALSTGDLHYEIDIAKNLQLVSYNFTSLNLSLKEGQANYSYSITPTLPALAGKAYKALVVGANENTAEWSNLAIIPADDIAARDNLNLNEGAVVYTKHNCTSYVYRGGSWLVLQRYGNQAHLSGTSTIFVSTSGDDEIGDGLTEGTAFRQPQRAFDDINPLSTAAVLVRCGPGSFVAPIYRSIPNYGLRITVLGDVSSPTDTFAVPTFSLVSGRAARVQGSIGAYSTVLSAGSHWLFSGTAAAPVSADAVFPGSASPNIDLADRSTFTYGRDHTEMHAYTTTFTAPSTGAAGSVATLRSPYGVTFMGVKFTGTQQRSANYVGCAFVSGTMNMDDCNIVGCHFTAAALLTGTNGGAAGCDGSYFGAGIYTQGSKAGISNSIVTGGSFGQIVPNLNGTLTFLSGIDFEGTGKCVFNSFASLTRFVQGGDIKVVNASTRFLELNSGSSYIRRGGTIAGAINGVPIVLSDSSYASGIEAAAGANLTNTASAGNEITVGANASVAITALPTNDFAVGNTSQGCRAA